jgi:hypothetical protein
MSLNPTLGSGCRRTLCSRSQAVGSDVEALLHLSYTKTRYDICGGRAYLSNLSTQSMDSWQRAMTRSTDCSANTVLLCILEKNSCRWYSLHVRGKMEEFIRLKKSHCEGSVTGGELNFGEGNGCVGGFLSGEARRGPVGTPCGAVGLDAGAGE